MRDEDKELLMCIGGLTFCVISFLSILLVCGIIF